MLGNNTQLGYHGNNLIYSNSVNNKIRILLSGIQNLNLKYFIQANCSLHSYRAGRINNFSKAIPFLCFIPVDWLTETLFLVWLSCQNGRKAKNIDRDPISVFIPAWNCSVCSVKFQLCVRTSPRTQTVQLLRAQIPKA